MSDLAPAATTVPTLTPVVDADRPRRRKMPLGLWFGWLRQRTDSLWPSLVAHMANNGLAVVAAALIDK